MKNKFDTLFEAIYSEINGGVMIAPGSSLNTPDEPNQSLRPILKYAAMNHGKEIGALNQQEAGEQTAQLYKQFWKKVLDEYRKIGEPASNLINSLSKTYGLPLEDVLSNYITSFIHKSDPDWQIAFTKREGEQGTNIENYEKETQQLKPGQKDSFTKHFDKKQTNRHGSVAPTATAQDKAKSSLESEIDRINPARYRPDKHQGY